jgi:UDP-GlcNAc:undecaprenyl-phosphate GlcNAc-1-phosphate transferase
MSYSVILIAIAILLVIEILYFKLATKFNIVDLPNYRSSHSDSTIRGGGIIFIISLILYYFIVDHIYLYFILGLITVGTISFLDDMQSVGRKLRLLFHLIAVALMFHQLGLFTFPIYWILLGLFIVIGSVNAINFMDGINGITGLYGLVVLSSLLYVNNQLYSFTNSGFLLTSILSVLVFLFFNFRIKARCFAGDVGSIGIAFIMLFFILQAIIQTHDFKYLFFLMLYGADSISTILFRLIRGENISDPHRTHFYQFLANEKGNPHLMVALIYGLIQLGINCLILKIEFNSQLFFILTMLGLLFIFLVIRFVLEGSARLLGKL